MDRKEHLQWAKDRALAELQPGRGGYPVAMSSLIQDFALHEELRGHTALILMSMLAFSEQITNDDHMREFINGII